MPTTPTRRRCSQRRVQQRWKVADWQHSGGALPPPFLRDPRSECPRLDTPFVTDEVGGLPVLPDDLEQALAAYLPESEAEGGASA